ncbi:MAG: cupin domain-containing protein, partial [Phoenicibacter congonensis]|nr:cupin domain-containing protein [Phoenicibacter congonensis]
MNYHNDMDEVVGKVFSIAANNQPVRGCTMSRAIHRGSNPVIYFSLAQNTDISAETFPYHKLILVAEGELEIYGFTAKKLILHEGNLILTPVDSLVGMRTEKSAIYTEIEIGRSDKMNEAIQPGEIFKMADLLPYAEKRVLNMDIVHNDKMKFVMMAFDAGQGLSEHSAPGEAIIFAIDGEGLIGYEGKEHTIKAGECFHFAKNGRHWVEAKTN